MNIPPLSVSFIFRSKHEECVTEQCLLYSIYISVQYRRWLLSGLINALPIWKS